MDKFKDEYPKAGNEQRFKCGCRVTALLPWEVIQHCRNEGRWCLSFCKLLQFERLTVAVRRAKDGDVRSCAFSSSFCKVWPEGQKRKKSRVMSGEFEDGADGPSIPVVPGGGSFRADSIQYTCKFCR